MDNMNLYDGLLINFILVADKLTAIKVKRQKGTAREGCTGFPRISNHVGESIAFVKDRPS